MSQAGDAKGQDVVKASKILEGGNFDLKTRWVISKAFVAAWHKIAPNFGTLERDIEGGQTRLAEAIMRVARADSRDPDRLAADALALMALTYKRKPGS
jgi:hypothetical protein